MHESVKKLVDDLNAAGGPGGSVSEMNRIFAEWLTAHNDEKDFRDAHFKDVTLSEAKFSGRDFTRARFEGCYLPHANFSSATLKGARFYGFPRSSLPSASFINVNAAGATFACDLIETDFSTAAIVSVKFDGSNLRGAMFTGANIEFASFQNVQFDSATKFDRLRSAEHAAFDRYALASLGPAKGGLTEGHLMDIRRIDDVETLRSQFGGIWGLMHAVAVVAFVFPYTWFLAKLWMRVRLLKPSNENSITVLEAITRFILRGPDWQSGWAPKWTFAAFVTFLTYNIARALMLWKTKKLETLQSITETPARFHLTYPVYRPRSSTSMRLNKVRHGIAIRLSWLTWNKIYKTTELLFAFAIIAWLYNTFQFLLLRVPLPIGSE